jgi:hypothetical protein
MRNEIALLVINIVLACACFTLGMWLAPHVQAQTTQNPEVPGLPFQIYGAVRNSAGGPAADVSISAYINGAIVASTTTDEEGNYGTEPHLFIIPDQDGKFAGIDVTLKAQGGESHEIPFEAGTLENVPLTTTLSPATQKAVSESAATQLGNSIGNSISGSSIKGMQNSIQQPVSQFPPKSHLVFGIPAASPVPAKYHGDILQLQKGHASYYKTVNPSYYEHTGILGTSAGLLVIILLTWVFYQNYTYARKKSR